MKKMLLGSTEALEELMNEDIHDNEPDTVQMGIPLFIRLLEYARESVKDDAELHSITERLTEICMNGNVATMDDYDKIIDKSEDESLDPSTEGLRNDTPSAVIINMKNIDQANALTKALNAFKKKSNVGGDVEMFITVSDDKPESCGGIGHDVTIGDIVHSIHKSDK